MLNIKGLLLKLVPRSGLGHLRETYTTWSGVGLFGALTADFLDRQSELRYAAYYTNAVNDAVGYNFWILLSVIALLLFCVTLPLIYFTPIFPRLQLAANPLRRISYTFFLVAFDEGSLMIGILLANFLHTSDKTGMLTTKSFLFSETGILTILGLSTVNSVLWFLGESIYNRNDQKCSGIVSQLVRLPFRYLAPSYLILTGFGLFFILNQ